MTFSNMKKLGRAFALGTGLVYSTGLSAQTADCQYVVNNDWGSGATASIELTNTSDTAINGWSVNWEYNTNTLSSSWNVSVSGDNPYTGSDVGWNGPIQPGQSVSFGLKVASNGGSIETPPVTGSICGDPPQSSSSSSTSSHDGSSSNSSRSSSSSSSSFSSSSSSSNDNGGDDLTAVQLTDELGVGWNLGNSLDAVGGETAWGNPEVNEALIDAVKAAGFDTVRVPVAWSKFSDEENFVIEQNWLNRVEEVVNYALAEDLYVIVNIHWDNGWMQPTYAEQDYVNNRLNIMWTQIANHFKNYDNRLLFAGTNEVMVEGDYGTPTEEYYTVQNSFNQTFVDTVRATGGNNDDRYLVVQGFNTNIDHTVNFAEIPDDPASDRLLIEVHYYDPYGFTLNQDSNVTQWGSIATDPNATAGWGNEDWVDTQFERMQTKFVDQGVGVILGEYGVISRPNVSDHATYRNYWNQCITESAIEHDLVPIYWDNGYAGAGGFALFDRYTGGEIEPELIDILTGAAP